MNEFKKSDLALLLEKVESKTKIIGTREEMISKIYEEKDYKKITQEELDNIISSANNLKDDRIKLELRGYIIEGITIDKKLTKLNIDNCIFKDVEMSMSKISNCRIFNSEFISCKINCIHIEKVVIENCKIKNSAFDTRISKSIIKDTMIKGCNLTLGSIKDSRVSNCKLIGSHGSRLNIPIISNTNFVGVGISGYIIYVYEVNKCGFTNISITGFSLYTGILSDCKIDKFNIKDMDVVLDLNGTYLPESFIIGNHTNIAIRIWNPILGNYFELQPREIRSLEDSRNIVEEANANISRIEDDVDFIINMNNDKYKEF